MTDSNSSLPDVHHFIDGQRTASLDGASFQSFDPETDQPLAVVAKASSEDVRLAVDAAQRAFSVVRAASPSVRERLLTAAASALQKRRDTIIDRLVREIGSPIGKANLEMKIAAETLQATAGIPRRMTGKTFAADTPMSEDRTPALSYSVRVPLGVTAAITPFNVPLVKGVKHASMGLATGNSVVWLPSPETAWIADAVADVFAEALETVDLPGGAFNVIHGEGSQIGDALVCDRRVKAVGFTGSTRTGRHVQAACGSHGKRVTLELGGKNPLIVLEGAEIPAAVRAAVLGGFLYQGQICMSTSRIIVAESIAESFRERLVAAVSEVGRGALMDPATMIGPIIHADARKRIHVHLSDALRHGAKVVCGGQWTGNRLNPTILEGVTDEMRMANEETFGPVVSLEVARDDEQALELVAGGPSMLVASVFTRRIDNALRFAEAIPSAMVHFNDMTIRQQAEVPFGGEGESGFGREGLETGIDDFTRWKWVTIR
ncbi:MAG: aldehyde dehydrogenase family protein [Planctomycetota bacterium]